MTYTMKVAGLERQLPLCKVSDDLYIGAFIMFGDAELTVACAKALLDVTPAEPAAAPTRFPQDESLPTTPAPAARVFAGKEKIA